MYDKLREKIEKTIKENTPESVLFSGGVDSTAILYHANKYNPDVKAITVGVEGKENPDITYSKKVAKELGIKNHEIFYVTEKQVKSMVDTAVKILGSFNPEWVSSTTTLLLGTMYAKKAGLKSISSGEGADDILGSFPFFTNWKGNEKDLEELIKTRIKEIVVMSDLIAKNLNMEYIAPFQEESVKKEILDIPIKERMKIEGDIKTKYPLRKAYEEILPKICITRPQTMAFSGSGIYDTIKSIGNDISDKEFYEASKKYFKFRNKFEYKLFKIYNKYYKFQQLEKGGCVHCGSDMKGNKVNCKTCATLQIDGKELSFDGGTKDKNENVKGAEAIVLHNGNIVLGMQNKKRWYELEDGKKGAIIKTIGGKMEESDNNDSKKAVLREIFEEIDGINESKIQITKKPVFNKKVKLGEINPYQKESKIKMGADFYLAEIKGKDKIKPKDIPGIVEIPVQELIKMKTGTNMPIEKLEQKGEIIIKEGEKKPDNIAIMIPEEVKNIFREDLER